MKQTYTVEEAELISEAATLLANTGAAFCYYQERVMVMSEKLRRLLKKDAPFDRSTSEASDDAPPS